jgi:hypothetical protein
MAALMDRTVMTRSVVSVVMKVEVAMPEVHAAQKRNQAP